MTSNRTRMTEPAANQQLPPISELIDRLSRFDGPPEQFLLNLLAVQCMIASASAGAFIRSDNSGQAEVLAIYPPLPQDSPAPLWLSQAAESLPQVAQTGQTLVRPVRLPDAMYGQPVDKHVVLLPLRSGAGLRGLAAFVVEATTNEQLQAATQQLELTISLLSLYEMRLTLQRRQVDLKRLRMPMEILSSINEPDRFAGAAMAMVNEIAARWQCHRVSLGFLKGRYIYLKALSHTEKFSRKMKLIQDIEAAMEECLDQDVEIVFPLPPDATYVSRATSELSRLQGPSSVLSMPLRRGGEVVAVMTLERLADKPFTLEEVEAVRLACDLCAARLSGLHEHDRWFGARAAQAIRKQLATFLGPKHTWVKLLGIGIFVLLLVMIFGKGDYTAEGPFVVEAIERQIISAPIEGTLDSVGVEIGDKVIANETVLAAMDMTDLKSELAKAQADEKTYRKNAAAAEAASLMDRSKLVEVQKANAQADKAAEQAKYLSNRINEANIKSPITGIVVMGDLKRLSKPKVKTGDPLFEVAPLDSLRAEISVPEDQITHVTVGMPGELATTADPGEYLRFTVERISPVAESVNQQNVYKVRVKFDGDDFNANKEWLRPGMEGVAKVN
ncbi:MAG: HlyD family efflux transporter periplasmic adaptor subunit, partial [Planctomycetaceae bacterium]